MTHAGFTVGDAQAADPLTVTLSATHGTIRLATTAGPTFAGSRADHAAALRTVTVTSTTLAGTSGAANREGGRVLWGGLGADDAGPTLTLRHGATGTGTGLPPTSQESIRRHRRRQPLAGNAFPSHPSR